MIKFSTTTFDIGVSKKNSKLTFKSFIDELDLVLASSSYISEVNINDYSTDFDEYELKEYFEKPFLDNNYDCRHSFDSFNYIEPEFSADFILTIDNIDYNINIMNGVEVILLFISRGYEQDLKFSGVTTRIHNLLANIFNEFNGKIFVNEESRIYSNNDIFTLSPVINDSGDAYTCIPVRGENDNYEYNFTFNMNNYEDITSAYKFLLIEFYEELSKFYYLNKCSLEMHANWAVIQSDIYKLLMDDSYESRKWYSLPVSPRRVRTLLTDIILFENIVFTEKDFMEKSH
jgi:hypothetical protein